MVGATLDSRLGLEAVSDVAFLKKLWRIIRKRLRAHRFQDFELAKDPLEWLAFDWELDTALATLRTDLLTGRYRAGAPEIVRTAKAVGLTRPLAYLQPLDLILYKAIVASAEVSLLRNTPSWARPGRFDTRPDDEAPAESGWFRSFLRRQGQIWRITQNHKYVVETDIANFFPYVHLPAVLAHVLESSNLSQEVVRVLEHMLIQFSPMTEYRRTPTTGLPQDGFDCSRVIAHTYLSVVDKEFKEEGEADRYSRYMDDIVIGARTRDEALQQIRRIQLALERIGLYPNTAKTRVLQRTRFVEEYLKDENDFLGEVEDRLKQGAPVDRSDFRRHLRTHIQMDPRPARSWSRVLRRYYTVSRRLEDPALLGWAYRHLEESPDSARHIFDYLSVFRITETRFKNLIQVLDRLGGVYEDLDILAQEYLATVPNIRDSNLTVALADWALQVALDRLESSPRIAAAALMTAGKFASERHLEHLDRLFDETMTADSVARQQALLVLIGTRRLSLEELRSLAPAAGSQTLSHLAFLRALNDAEPKAVKMTMVLLTPLKRGAPDRYMCRPRSLFLAPVISDVDPAQRAPLAAFRDRL